MLCLAPYFKNTKFNFQPHKSITQIISIVKGIRSLPSNPWKVKHFKEQMPVDLCFCNIYFTFSPFTG